MRKDVEEAYILLEISLHNRGEFITWAEAAATLVLADETVEGRRNKEDGCPHTNCIHEHRYSHTQ